MLENYFQFPKTTKVCCWWLEMFFHWSILTQPEKLQALSMYEIVDQSLWNYTLNWIWQLIHLRLTVPQTNGCKWKKQKNNSRFYWTNFTSLFSMWTLFNFEPTWLFFNAWQLLKSINQLQIKTSFKKPPKVLKNWRLE